MKDISKLHGKRFTATILGTKTSGKISYEPESNYLYLCQNDRNGNYTRDRLGYMYSWFIDSSIDPASLERRFSVRDFKINTNSTWEDLTVGDKLKSRSFGREWEVAAKIGGRIYILIDEDGRASINCTLKELIESFNLVQEEEEKEEIVEVTLEDVAKNMGIPVEKLRIKD